MAREVSGPGTPALAAIVDRFGVGVLLPDGSLDRPGLGRLVFADPAALADLEAIVHPAVRPGSRPTCVRRRKPARRSSSIEAIRLVEAGYAAECDEVWLVVCDAERRSGCVLVAAADADQRIAAQGDLSAGGPPRPASQSDGPATSAAASRESSRPA